jgi:hypothetical protein
MINCFHHIMSTFSMGGSRDDQMFEIMSLLDLASSICKLSSRLTYLHLSPSILLISVKLTNDNQEPN